MALAKESSVALVTKFGANEKDTGNTKVQVAILQNELSNLQNTQSVFQKIKVQSVHF